MKIIIIFKNNFLNICNKKMIDKNLVQKPVVECNNSATINSKKNFK